MSFYWPIFLSVFSGVVYQISSKSAPKEMDTLASLTVTYFIAAVFAGILYYLTHEDANLLREYSRLNWTPYVLGFAVIGIDFGNRFMYRVGWSISNGYIVNSVLLSVALLAVGFFVYKEGISWTKLAGTLFCLLGVSLITK